MTMTDREAFAAGVNEAIRALRTLYGGVRTVFQELADALEVQPDPLFDLGVRVRPRTTRTDPDERFLRTWEGRFFSDEPSEPEAENEEEDAGEEDDGDGGSSKNKLIQLASGQQLAFAKVVLYHPGGAEEGEPHLLYGVLQNVHVAGGWESIEVKRSYFRKVMELLRQDMRVGEIQTKATALWPDAKLKALNKGGNRIRFALESPPAVFPLFDLRSSEDVGRVARLIKDQWQVKRAV